MDDLTRNRWIAIQNRLLASHQASSGMSSASSGTEREHFVSDFLSLVLPSVRFGSGDITDGVKQTGQVDLVVEFPNSSSLGIGGGVRLYNANSVAVAIEVKSNLAAQWKQVKGKAEVVRSVRRNYMQTVGFGYPPGREIPFLAVGYIGWADPADLRSKLEGCNEVDAVLQISPGYFIAKERHEPHALAGITIRPASTGDSSKFPEFITIGGVEALQPALALQACVQWIHTEAQRNHHGA